MPPPQPTAAGEDGDDDDRSGMGGEEEQKGSGAPQSARERFAAIKQRKKAEKAKKRQQEETAAVQKRLREMEKERKQEAELRRKEVEQVEEAKAALVEESKEVEKETQNQAAKQAALQDKVINMDVDATVKKIGNVLESVDQAKKEATSTKAKSGDVMQKAEASAVDAASKLQDLEQKRKADEARRAEAEAKKIWIKKAVSKAKIGFMKLSKMFMKKVFAGQNKDEKAKKGMAALIAELKSNHDQGGAEVPAHLQKRYQSMIEVAEDALATLSAGDSETAKLIERMTSTLKEMRDVQKSASQQIVLMDDLLQKYGELEEQLLEQAELAELGDDDDDGKKLN